MQLRLVQKLQMIFCELNSGKSLIISFKILEIQNIAYIRLLLLLFDVTTLKMARKPVKLQKESPAGCAGEGKQSKGN